MLKKDITYTNPFTDEQVTEEHYFHISKADLVEMEMEEHGTTYMKDGEELTGMHAKLQRITDSEDGRAIVAEFKDMIRRSYGKKEDNRFLKSQAIWDDFAASEAFSELLFELCTNAGAAAEFVNAVVPSNLDQIAAEVREKAQQATAEGDSTTRAQNGDGTDNLDPTGLTNKTTPRVLTQVDLREMDPTELQAGLSDGRYKLS